jgi:hypothetical protein
MIHRSWWCWLILCWIAGVAAGQETRTFPEAECSYTPPGKGWEWLDTGLMQGLGGKSVVAVQNADGLRFVVRFDYLQKGELTGSKAFEEYEMGMLKSGRLKKLGSRHGTFRGVPSYQIDLLTPGGQGASIRVLNAHDRFYELHLGNTAGPLDAEADLEPIFQGFNFTKPPKPNPPPASPESPRPAHEDVNFRRGQEAALFVSSCVGVLFIGGVVGLIVYLQRRRSADDRWGRHDDRDY